MDLGTQDGDGLMARVWGPDTPRRRRTDVTPEPAEPTEIEPVVEAELPEDKKEST